MRRIAIHCQNHKESRPAMRIDIGPQRDRRLILRRLLGFVNRHAFRLVMIQKSPFQWASEPYGSERHEIEQAVGTMSVEFRTRGASALAEWDGGNQDCRSTFRR